MSNYNFDLDLDSKNTMSVMNSWIKENSCVLEFGPANGRLTKYLTCEKHCQVTIVEIDEIAGKEAAQYAECAYIGPVDGDINHLCWFNTDKRYDYIVFADVLEHLSDPREILLKCKELLTDNGEILVSIPNIAHNSILIDLYNDKFDYDDVGLLDKTHIHFFTYHSFANMIYNIGLFITKQESIFSNVGWNEIHNSYTDVPYGMERELRKRKSGSIYQYLFSLSNQEPSVQPTYENIEIFPEQADEPKEICCYYWENMLQPNDFKRLFEIYTCAQSKICRFMINANVARLRLDPIKNSALILLHYIHIKYADGSEKDNVIANHNAKNVIDNLYYFSDKDPWFELIAENENTLEYVEIHFKILDHDMDDRQDYIYHTLFSCIHNEAGTVKSALDCDNHFQNMPENTEAPTEYQKQVQNNTRHSAKKEEDFMFDIVYVSYNSEKWIPSCFQSLLDADYDIKQLNVFVVDNHSTDKTPSLLRAFQDEHGHKFASFTIIEESENLGFGKANNLGFSKGNSNVVCFLNIDTEVFPDTFKELAKEVASSKEQVALWEFRQFPYEHPKMYDILTGETTWSSGAAFAARREVFAEMNGFDDKIFMYAEDVDLSWRLRTAGYLLKYVPRVKITHHSYESANVIKPNQHVYGVINNLLLRYRFGGKKTILMGHLLFWNLMRRPKAFPGSKKLLFKQYVKHFRLIPHFHADGMYKQNKTSVGNFSGWDYCAIKDGAYYENFLSKETPLVSIIVRTCGRPAILRETLISLRKQTYDNIEIVIVEDGPSVSENMIKQEFSDLNILYQATQTKVGRSKAGNLAMQLANGKYLNFLDDDDLFYADHVEVLVANLEKSGLKAAYATSFETPIEIFSKDPYEYRVVHLIGRHKQPFDRIMLCHHNYIPIQCIMFSKELFAEYGGLDESVDALEDWDLWVRYSLHTDFAFILKTTSVYRVPASAKINRERQQALDDALIVMREKHKSYLPNVNVYDIAKLYEQINL